MEKELMEAHINSSGASKAEIASSFNEAYDVIRRIVKKYMGMRSTKTNVTVVDQVTYVVSFVHPEIKDLNVKAGAGVAGYTNTPRSILDGYAVMPQVNTGNGARITEARLPYANQPMVTLLNAVTGGILSELLNAQPRGAYEDDASSAYGAGAFERKAEELQEQVLTNKKYTTIEFIKSKLGNVDDNLAAGRDELIASIDFDSLFGFSRADVTAGQNGDNAWGVLSSLEHWFYALVSHNISEETKAEAGNPEDMGESVFTYVRAIRELMKKPDVAKLLHAIDLALVNPTVAGNEIAAGGELRLNTDMYQLGALIALTPNSTVKDGNTLAKYLMGLVSEPEEYARGMAALQEFINAPVGYDDKGKRRMVKVNPDSWKPKYLAAIAQNNAQENENPVAARLAKQLSRLPDVSGALQALKSSGALKQAQTDKFGMAAVLGWMVSQYNPADPTDNIECGLVADPENAGDNIGIKVQLSSDEKIQRANAIKTPMDLVNDFTNFVTPKKSSNLLAQDDMVVSILDPEVDEVKGSVVLPKWSVPMFATGIKFPKSYDSNEHALSTIATALIAYAAIAFNDNGIVEQTGAMPWFVKGQTNYGDEIVDSETGEPGTTLEFAHSNIDPSKISDAIENYFKWIVTNSTDASNVIRLRNEWVSALREPESWGIIFRATYGYLRWYILSGRLKISGAENSEAEDRERAMLDEKLTDTIIPGAKDFVNRYILNVKQGSRDLQVSNDVTALSVKPIAPINLSENGRLRKSGGDEGTVTSDGKALLANTMGKVVGVRHNGGVDRRTGETVSNNTYKVFFKQSSGLVSGEFTDKMLDSWMPEGLVVTVDSAAKTTQYSLWIGVSFVDLQTDEGNLGAFRTSPEEIDASNAAYMNSVVGSPSYMNSTKNAISAGTSLDTVSGPALGAVRRTGDIINGLGSKTFNQIYDMLRFAASPKVAADESFDSAIGVREIAGKPADKAASDILSGVASVFTATKMDIEGDTFYCDVDSTRTLHELIALCNRKAFAANPKACLSRLGSALTSLAEVADNPFVIGNADSKYIDIENNGEDISHTEQFELNGNGDAFTALIGELRDDGQEIYRVMEQDDGDAAGVYAVSMEHLKELAGMFDADFRNAFATSTSLRGRSTTQAELEQTMNKYAPLLSSQEAYDVLADVLGQIVPELRQSPEIMNKSLLDVLNSTYYARQVPDELARGRDPRTDYDRHAGRPERRTFTGSEGNEQLLTPDYTGEGDDFSGAMLTNSIDHEALMDFDVSSGRSDYEGVSSQYPMLNMVACDEMGMHSGNGSFSPLTGISPPEFEQFASALDSAHESVTKVEDGAVGKNAAIREYANSKNYILDQAIDAFYGFMTSQKPLARRNVVSDALAVGANLESVVDSCGDYTVRHMLLEVLRAYRSAITKAINQSKEAGAMDNIGRIEADFAKKISTVIANSVLYLDAAIETEMPTSDPEALEIYGKRNRSGYENDSGIADRLATVSAINPDARPKQTSRELERKTLAVAKTRMTKEISGKFRSSMDYGVGEMGRFADTLSNIYERIGKSSTLGYEGAISPFNDLLEKSEKKLDKPYATLYTGESRNDLGAVIMYAIVSDERSRNSGTTTKYGMVENIVSMLTGNVADEAGRGRQTPICVPKYLVKGLSMDADDELDYGSTVWAMFREDGSSVISARPNGGFDEQPPAFAGLSAIGRTIEVPLSDDDTIDEAVGKIRTAVIERKISNNTALETLARKDAGTNKKIYSDTIEKFVDTMRAAAGQTMETPTTFVPLSVLYTCLDDKALNTAMHVVFEKAANVLRDRQNENASAEIMRSIAGEQYGEVPEVGEIAAENEDYLVQDFARALQVMKSDVGTLQSRKRKAISSRNTNNIDGDEVDIPGSSLKEILGEEKAAECLDVLMQQVPMHVLATMDDNDREDQARAFVRSMVARNNGTDTNEPLARIANTLYSIADGAMPVSTGIHDITTTIGARNDALATRLVKDYCTSIGAGMPAEGSAEGVVTDVSPARMRNMAIQMVNRELNTRGEFRSLLLDKYPNEGANELQARKIMHGKVHPFGTSSIGDANSLSVMYDKVKSALNGTMDADRADELLSETFFSIDKVTGEAAIAAFNRYFNELKKKLASVVKSTNTGVAAQLRINGANGTVNAKDQEKVEANVCADAEHPTDGPARKLAMEKLEDTKQVIIRAIGKKSAGDSIASFNAALDVFMDQHCTWSTSMTDEELAEVKAATTPLNNQALAADYVALRDAMAGAFASSNDRYHHDVRSVVGMTSSATGINVDMVLPPSKLRTLADTMATIKDSPIKKVDTDMHNKEYEIDGKPVSWNKCMVILNAALNMCGLPEGAGSDTPVRDLVTEELFRCVRRCASSVRDLPLMPDSVASILLSTMLKRKLITLSPFDRCVRMKHRFAGRDRNGWFIFDIPVSSVYGLVEDKIAHTDYSKSLNDWKAFSDEIDRYTNTGNRLNSYRITNHELGNQLWDLFSSVQQTLFAQLDSYLGNLDDDDFDRLCRSHNGMDTEDGTHITKSNVEGGQNGDDSANAFPRRKKLGDTYEDRSQEIEFPERFPRDTRPLRQPEEPDEPLDAEPEEPDEHLDADPGEPDEQ